MITERITAPSAASKIQKPADFLRAGPNESVCYLQDPANIRNVFGTFSDYKDPYHNTECLPSIEKAVNLSDPVLLSAVLVNQKMLESVFWIFGYHFFSRWSITEWPLISKIALRSENTALAEFLSSQPLYSARVAGCGDLAQTFREDLFARIPDSIVLKGLRREELPWQEVANVLSLEAAKPDFVLRALSRMWDKKGVIEERGERSGRGSGLFYYLSRSPESMEKIIDSIPEVKFLSLPRGKETILMEVREEKIRREGEANEAAALATGQYLEYLESLRRSAGGQK